MRTCLQFLVAAVLVVGCGGKGDEGPDAGPCGDAGVCVDGTCPDEFGHCPDELGRCATFDPLKQPFFGDTHVHTNLSLDAVLQGTRPSPAGAYRFAKGEPTGLQPYDEDGNPSRTLSIDRPLDFVAVSDHAEFFGTVAVCQDPESAAFDTPDCMSFRETPDTAFVAINVLTASPPNGVMYPPLCGTDNERCSQASADVWREVQTAAEEAYDRTDACTFTSFVGYEWSAGPSVRNLHRNVIFRNDVVPEFPVSYLDEPYVEDLWSALRDDCVDADGPCDALTIPHNSNLAVGTFFENKDKNGEPFDQSYALERATMEPIIEVFQHKGDSECKPFEPVVDELCGFEKLPYGNLAEVNLQGFGSDSPSDYLRSAYGEGLRFERDLGANPFKHGMIASTDTHIATPGAVGEATFPGHGGAGQPNRDVFPEAFPDIPYLNPGGLAGVWAEENSREAIFLAMRNKETFGTSGPRIVPRFFGGYDLPTDLCDSSDFAATGYAMGVPMGGQLGQAPAEAQLRFAVSALKDPDSPVSLQRIQIVKGYLDGDEYKVEIYDVAGDAKNGATVNLDTCESLGDGAASLCAVWTDDSFSPLQHAYYYARVIENPSCRWTVAQCVAASYDCDDPVRPIDVACCKPAVGLNTSGCGEVKCPAIDDLGRDPDPCCEPRMQTTIQERAWTSPIWHTPSLD